MTLTTGVVSAIIYIPYDHNYAYNDVAKVVGRWKVYLSNQLLAWKLWLVFSCGTNIRKMSEVGVRNILRLFQTLHPQNKKPIWALWSPDPGVNMPRSPVENLVFVCNLFIFMSRGSHHQPNLSHHEPVKYWCMRSPGYNMSIVYLNISCISMNKSILLPQDSGPHGEQRCT